MKYGKILAAVLIGSTFFIGCGKDTTTENPPATSQNPADSTGTESPDTITSPSKVTDEITLIEALNEKGPWIVIPSKRYQN